MATLRAWLAASSASILASVLLTSCAGSFNDDVLLTGVADPPAELPAIQAPVDSRGWPAQLPADKRQPWERLDAAGQVIPPDRSVNYINADSRYAPGVEREAESADGVTDNDEAASFDSGDVGDGDLSWAWWRLTLGGEQPGVVTADVNLLPMNNGGRSTYYVGLSNYGAECWEWHGPFSDSHTRLSVPAGNYLSDLGNLFVCITAYDGAAFDVVGVAANSRDSGDTEAPAAPSGLSATPVAAALELTWDEVVAADLAGYRIYYSSSMFTDASSTGVRSVPALEGLTYHQLAAGGETYVRIGAVDISGNESALSDIVSATPLAGEILDVWLAASQPSALIGEAVSLTATGADEYEWDLDGDGIFELTGDLTGTQQLDTSRAGFIRPVVRGLADGGSSRACGGVSVLVGANSRPLATAYADPAFGPAPLQVTFTGTGEDDDGAIAGYAWDFDGDGTYDYTDATEPDPPVQEYGSSGTYNVKFRVEDNLGLTDVDTVAVTVSDPLNIPPTADLTTSPGGERGNPPHEVNFDASASTDTDGTIVEYLWDFENDGEFDDWSDGPQATHVYTQPGTHTAAVRVEDDQGARDTATMEISVNFAPVADLEADVTAGDPPFTVNFDASGSTDPDGTVDDYEWDLDADGVFNETGDEADAQGSDTASFSYTTSGFFLAAVRVTDNEGLQDTATLEIKSRGWALLTLDDSEEAGDDLMCLTVVNGNPAISYDRYEISLQYIRSTTPTGSRLEDWGDSVTIVSGDHEHSSLAVVDGNPAISWVDYNDSSLSYARSTTSTGDSASDWSNVVTVDDTYRSGFYSSLAIVDGNPAISYAYRDTSYEHDLKYARSTTSTGTSADDWTQIVTIDSTGDVGTDTSLAVVDGCPAISYRDNDNTSLKYARATTSDGASASDWTLILTVDSGGSVGYYSCLVVVDGYPAISYTDSGNSDLKYVRASNASGSAWSTPIIVDSTDAVGWYTWMAIVDGNPAISYHDSTNGNLKYARSETATGGSASDWTEIVTVDDTSSDVGDYTSMAYVAGSPAIAYYDYTNDALKYAYYVQ